MVESARRSARPLPPTLTKIRYRQSATQLHCPLWRPWGFGPQAEKTDKNGIFGDISTKFGCRISRISMERDIVILGLMANEGAEVATLVIGRTDSPPLATFRRDADSSRFILSERARIAQADNRRSTSPDLLSPVAAALGVSHANPQISEFQHRPRWSSWPGQSRTAGNSVSPVLCWDGHLADF